MPAESLVPLGLLLLFTLLLWDGTPPVGVAQTLLRRWAPLGFGLFLSLTTWYLYGRPDPLPLLFAALFSFFGAAQWAARLPGESRWAHFLDAAWTPALLGGISALVIAWIWGSLDPIPTIHDETAYLLQARLFAHGRWTGSAPPLPEFFEQLYVLVTPVIASKYPPGTSLLLVPGVLLGVPALVPLFLTGLAGGLTFSLARRIANRWIGLLTWAVWTTAPANLHYRPAYFSETVTSALWLAGWWALLEWRDTGRRRWLLLLAGCVGWSAITRPLTAVVYAIPVAIVVLKLGWKRRVWLDLGAATLLGAAIVAILPIWNARTTGDWRTMPLALYNRTYMPNDMPGFDPNIRPPSRPLPPDLNRVNAKFLKMKREHTWTNAPRELGRRAFAVVWESWQDWRFFMLLFALLGLPALPAEGLFALVTSALLVVGYLPHTHGFYWTLYYLEVHPVLAFLTARGFWLSMRALETRAPRAGPGYAGASFAPLASLLATLALIAPATRDVRDFRLRHEREVAPSREFRSRIAALPEKRAIVFVRYRPDHDGNRSLVVNDPLLADARFWIVYDRGDENSRLIRLAPDRAPYLYDDSRKTLTRVASSDGGS